MARSIISPVAPDEFKFAFAVGMAAAAKKGPYRNPALYGLNIQDDETGQVTRYSPTDNGFSRAALAIKEQFDDSEKCFSIMMRTSGLMDLIDDERMKPYIRATTDGEMEIREEVLEVAAEAKFSSRHGFDSARFFRKLEVRLKMSAAS